MVGFVIVSSHDYTIELCTTTAHASTNDLSCLPLQESCNDDDVSEVSVFNVSEISVLPVSIVQLCKTTRADLILKKNIELPWKWKAFKYS